MGWITNSRRTLFTAIGWRWGLVIAAGFTLPGYAHSFATKHSMTALPDMDWTLFGIVGALLVILWRVLHYATDLRLVTDSKEKTLLERQIEVQEAHTEELRRTREQQARDNDPFTQGLRRKQAETFFGRPIQITPTTRPDGLEILHENTAEYEKAEPRQDYIIRTCFVVVHNRDITRSLANCEARLVYNNSNIPLVDNFTLTPGEKRRIPIVVHHEFHAHKYIHVLGPRVGGFFAEAFRHYDLPLTGTLLSLRITSTESVEAVRVFRAFVDDSGKLKMEAA